MQPEESYHTYLSVITIFFPVCFDDYFPVCQSDKEESITLKSIACSSEVWQILLHIGLNDLPLLVIRLTVMLNYQVSTNRVVEESGDARNYRT